jgi:hypothetical protein
VVPPLLDIPDINISTTAWATDVLPDFIWPCYHFVQDLDRGFDAVISALDAIAEAAASVGFDEPLTGQLSGLEAMPEEARTIALELLVERDIYDQAFSEAFAHSLGVYPDAPGSWLLEPWRDRGLTPDVAKAEAELGRVIAESFHGQMPVPTRAKAIYLRGLMKAGRMKLTDLDVVNLLPRYPNKLADKERLEVETFIRASFIASLRGESLIDSDADDRRVNWCRRFWRENWNLFACRKPDSGYLPAGSPAEFEKLLAEYSERANSLRLRFEKTALSVDPDLYDPDRYEVLTGIAARVVRLIEGAVSAPPLWTDEFGANLMRSIIEAKINIRWLEYKNDPEMYRAFKNYGRGRLKLLKLHTEAYTETLDEIPEHLTTYLEHLDEEVNADVWEEFQEIDIRTTFSGVSARQMAIDVGLKEDYDFVFAPASGTTHGDWIALDRYALVRCRSPLHLWHRIPSEQTDLLVDPAVMDTLLGMADEVIDIYVSIIATESTTGT